MGEQFQATEDEGNDSDSDAHEAMYDLNDQMVKRFMEGIAEKTETFLQCFVKDGKGCVDELLEAVGYKDLQDLRGLLGGITRRTRKLFNDPDAYIIGWQGDESDNSHNGYYFVMEGTRQALENYFK